LLFDHSTTAALDELRTSLGTNDLDRIPPHITLVPPIDLTPGQFDQLRPSVANVAVELPSLQLVLGPAATFAPRTMTIHLAVGGDLHSLDRLVDDLRVEPLPQRTRWPFVPHVTLREDAPGDLIERSLTSLAHVRFAVQLDAFHLLEHLPRPGAGRKCWRSIAAYPFRSGEGTVPQPPTQCGPSGS
jgi:2'-5' RNA ligase